MRNGMIIIDADGHTLDQFKRKSSVRTHNTCTALP
jgi:hypothetical protein